MKKKGFTLIECVVAILVITIISSIALSVLLSYRRAENEQWSKYQSAVFANNVLACFQGANDVGTFYNNVCQIQIPNSIKNSGDGSIGKTTISISEGEDSYTYDPRSVLSTVLFTKIRATEDSSTITFYNSDNKVIDLQYSSSSNYTTDKKFLNGRTDLYNIVKNEQKEVKKKVSNTTSFGGKKMNIDLQGDSATYTYNNTTVTHTQNPLEKFMYKNNYALFYKHGSVSGEYISLEFFVFDVANKKYIFESQNSTKRLYVTYNLYASKYDTTNKKVTLYSVKYKYESGSPFDIVDSETSENISSKMLASSVNVYDYISFFITKSGSTATTATVGDSFNDNGKYLTYSYTAPVAYKLYYTDYTLKSSAKSNIAYFKYSNSNNNLDFYNLSDDKIFSYTGTNKAKILEDLHFDLDDAKEKYIKSYHITKVVYEDSNKKIRFYYNSIPFLDFVYDDATKYSNDKESIVSGKYSIYFTNNGTVISSDLAKLYPKIRYTSGKYEILYEYYDSTQKKNVQTIAFSSDATRIDIYTQTLPATNSQEWEYKKINAKNSSASKVHWMLACGAYTVYVIGTYSDATFKITGLDLEETAPNVLIWVIPSEKINAGTIINQSNINDYEKYLYISYKKG